MPVTRLSGFLVIMAAAGLSCSYEGIDGSVFGRAAESAGRRPSVSLVDLSQGELGLAANITILFSLGFVAGRAWERLMARRDALPR